jgi:uroporphyrinogen decarboxylase
MTPRERVLAALAHRTPDRTPRDFWAEEPAWNRLLAHLGLADHEAVLRRLGIDLRHVNAVVPPEREVAPGLYQNFWGERYVPQPTPWGPMREDVRGALSGARTFAELQTFAWPANDDFDYARLTSEVEAHRHFALVYGFADVWQRPALVRGWEEFFVDLAERPRWAHFLCRKFTDFYLEDYARAARATLGRLDLYLLISDLGTQRGPLISSRMFREFVAPYLREMIDCIHGLGARVLFHSCGSIRAFIPELICLGVDVLDPIQPAGPEMLPEALQAEFGGKLCFHGGLDMQRLLPLGTPEAIRAEARRYREVLGRQGGYILSPAHLFQPDVPPENVLAVYQGDE